MIQNMTRAKAIKAWFAAVALLLVMAIAFGVDVTAGTAALLLALCVVPPIIVLMIWPGVEPPTAGDVVHGRDMRR